tara:strand:- start:9016 stop:9309 length:294 start_codon:yes stop_codon:yes gene_type:complete
MANATTAAGDNGAAGTQAAPGLVSTHGGVTGTLASGNKEAEGTDEAMRHSVARTQGGSYNGATNSGGNASEVYSMNQGFRTAYSGVEADVPAIDRTS